MTTVTQPTLQSAPPPDAQTVLEQLKQVIKKEINCARVAVIQEYDPSNNTVTAQIAQQQVTSTDPNGVRTIAAFPPLLVVPVVFPCGGGHTLTFPIAAGDECIIVFNDREMDNWFTSGAGLAPTTPRVHDLSDGFAIVGVRNSTRSLSNISTDSVQLRSDNGNTFVEINATTNALKVHAGTVYEWDVHGYGQKITWTGGTNWTIDNYTIGATVTTNNHSISPPGPP